MWVLLFILVLIIVLKINSVDRSFDDVHFLSGDEILIYWWSQHNITQIHNNVPWD